MKMNTEDYNQLHSLIKHRYDLLGKTSTQDLIRQYQANTAFKDYRVAFMWATFHGVKMNFSYLNDSHINTALKSIHKNLGLLYP